MPVLLDRSPFGEHSSDVNFGSETVLIRADQVIVWVSLTPRRIPEPNPLAVTFPAVIDTGFSHSFAINERQLTEWSGLSLETLGVLVSVRDRGQRISLRPLIFGVTPMRKVSEIVWPKSPLSGWPLPKASPFTLTAIFPDYRFWGCESSRKTIST